MNDKTLIEVVRNYSALYNLSDARSADTDCRNNIWQQIEQMKTSEQSNTPRWVNKRENFSKPVKENTTMSGRQANSTKLYKEQRTFSQKPFNEDIRSNIDAEVKDQDRSSGDEDNDTPDGSETQFHSLLNKPPLQERSKVIIPTETGSLRYPRRTREPNLLSEQQRPKTAAATFMEYLIKDKDTVCASTALSPHVVDTFLAGIAPALKKLTPGYWYYAKAEIFAAVQKYELKMFTEKEPIM